MSPRGAQPAPRLSSVSLSLWRGGGGRAPWRSRWQVRPLLAFIRASKPWGPGSPTPHRVRVGVPWPTVCPPWLPTLCLSHSPTRGGNLSAEEPTQHWSTQHRASPALTPSFLPPILTVGCVVRGVGTTLQCVPYVPPALHLPTSAGTRFLWHTLLTHTFALGSAHLLLLSFTCTPQSPSLD